MKKKNETPKASTRNIKKKEVVKEVKVSTKKTAPPLKAPLMGKLYNVKTPKQAKRLLSALILSFQKGEVNSRFAKDLCYLLSVFLTVYKESDFEIRLKALEGKVK